jgi:hypothetical protein
MPLRAGLIRVPFDHCRGTSRSASCTSHYYNLKWPFNPSARTLTYKVSNKMTQAVEILRLIISYHNLDSNTVLGQDMLQ